MKYFIFLAITILMVCCHGNKNTTSSGSSGNLKVIRFINSGDILSTYDLKDDADAVKAIREATGNNAGKMDEVYEYSNEKAWPSGMDEFEERLANKSTIMSFKAYLFCSFPHDSRGTLNILKIPKDENSKMPKGFQLTHDIYFVILSSGFEVK
ncbi:MAG: hypothetical protein M3R17_11455 [Bacteroidota bacterium]|nr:hypothetical protein [Bacteroidota bacterium]